MGEWATKVPLDSTWIVVVSRTAMDGGGGRTSGTPFGVPSYVARMMGLPAEDLSGLGASGVPELEGGRGPSFPSTFVRQAASERPVRPPVRAGEAVSSGHQGTESHIHRLMRQRSAGRVNEPEDVRAMRLRLQAMEARRAGEPSLPFASRPPEARHPGPGAGGARAVIARHHTRLGHRVPLRRRVGNRRPQHFTRDALNHCGRSKGAVPAGGNAVNPRTGRWGLHATHVHSPVLLFI